MVTKIGLKYQVNDFLSKRKTICINSLCYTPGGGGVLPYKGLMGTCGQPGYVFRDFYPKQGIDFIIFSLACLSNARLLKCSRFFFFWSDLVCRPRVPSEDRGNWG